MGDWDGIEHFHPPCILSILPTQTQYPNIYQELHLKALLIAKNIWEGFNLLILFSPSVRIHLWASSASKSEAVLDYN